MKNEVLCGLSQAEFELFVELFAESVCPGVDRAGINFLTEEANQRGGFRRVQLILDWAIKIAGDQGIRIDHRLFRNISQILAARRY